MIVLKRKLINIGLIAMGLIFTLNLSILALSASHSITPNISTIGDILKYQVKVSYKSKLELLPISVLNEYPFVYREHTNKVMDDNQIKTHIFTCYVSVYDTGEFVVPTQNIKFKKNNKEYLQTIPAIHFSVVSVFPESETKVYLKDINPMMNLKINYKRYIIISIILVLIFGIVIFVYKYWKKNRKETVAKKHVKATDIKSAYEIAIESLEKLNQENLVALKKEKIHYLRLTEIIKTYFSSIFHNKIMEMTSHELYDHVLNKMDEQTFKKLVKLMEFCDLVKFAKYHPEEEENQETQARALEIIERTRPQEKIKTIISEDNEQKGVGG
jgi:hypothetical protein